MCTSLSRAFIPPWSPGATGRRDRHTLGPDIAQLQTCVTGTLVHLIEHK